MRLATWNVNSIRSRIDRVTGWLERADVDVLAMQETKCTDAQFPTMPFAALGYEVVHVGHNQWNGVAIASRVGIDDVALGFDGQPEWNDVAEARAIGATCGGVRVWSLYIPNGRTVDDPHYAYKLKWLAALRDTSAEWLADDPASPIALVGDWNIAPTDDDVWDVEVFRAAPTSPSPSGPHFARSRSGSPTWSGRSRRRRATSPTGTTPNCASPSARACASTSSSAHRRWRRRVTHAEIARDERKPGKKGTPAPSDHAPVMVELDG